MSLLISGNQIIDTKNFPSNRKIFIFAMRWEIFSVNYQDVTAIFIQDTSIKALVDIIIVLF